MSHYPPLSRRPLPADVMAAAERAHADAALPIELRLAAARSRRDELETEAGIYRDDLPRVDIELPGCFGGCEQGRRECDCRPARVAPIRRSVPRVQPEPAIEIHHPRTLGARIARTLRELAAWLCGPRAF